MDEVFHVVPRMQNASHSLTHDTRKATKTPFWKAPAYLRPSTAPTNWRPSQPARNDAPASPLHREHAGRRSRGVESSANERCQIGTLQDRSRAAC